MRLSLTLALVAALGAPLEARAQDEPNASPRKLGGHTFAHPATIDSAFVDTFFGTRTTGRYETIGNIPIGKTTVDINSIGIGENVDFALALAEQFSVGLGLFGGALAGTSGPAIGTAGVRYSYGATLDAAFRIVRLESTATQVTVRGEIFGLQGGGQISLLPFIRALHDAPESDVPSILADFGALLITPVSRVGGAASLNVAQAITPAFSVQASFRLDVHRTVQSPFVVGVGRVDVASTAWIPQGGLALGAFPPGWPIALSAEWRISAQDSDAPSVSARHLGAVAAYYAARQDLQVGPVIAGELGLPVLQGIDANGDSKASDQRRAIWGQLMMRYFW